MMHDGKSWSQWSDHNCKPFYAWVEQTNLDFGEATKVDSRTRSLALLHKGHNMWKAITAGTRLAFLICMRQLQSFEPTNKTRSRSSPIQLQKLKCRSVATSMPKLARGQGGRRGGVRVLLLDFFFPLSLKMYLIRYRRH